MAAAPEFLAYIEGHLHDVEQLLADPSVACNWDWALTAQNLRALIAKVKS
jgi:hypothetical protein